MDRVEQFKWAIRFKRMVDVEFYSKEDDRWLSRRCAPLDYGPSSHAREKSDRFHLWDTSSDEKPHVLSLLPAQIRWMDILAETFDPHTIVTWNTTKSPWTVPRNWGEHS